MVIVVVVIELYRACMSGVIDWGYSDQSRCSSELTSQLRFII